MNSYDENRTRQISFDGRGLSLFPLGTKLEDSLKSEFRELDWALEKDINEYITLNGYYKKANEIILKKAIGPYVLEGAESVPFNLYLGVSSKNEILEIVLRLDLSFEKTKNLLIEYYGPPEVMGIGGTELSSSTSYLWSVADLEIYLSSWNNEIQFYLSPPVKF